MGSLRPNLRVIRTWAEGGGRDVMQVPLGGGRPAYLIPNAVRDLLGGHRSRVSRSLTAFGMRYGVLV
jgi:hypothetical protein